jgi:hypothetical protein
MTDWLYRPGPFDHYVDGFPLPSWKLLAGFGGFILLLLVAQPIIVFFRRWWQDIRRVSKQSSRH